MSATVDFILWKGTLVRTSVRSISFIVMFGLSAAMFIPTRHTLANGQTGHSATSAPEMDAESAANLLPGSTQLINPEALVNILQSPKTEKPLILNIGPHLLYMQAHIPGSEYIGSSSDSQGMESLLRRVKPLRRNTFIVLYCGCCPWNHCPNVRPAYYQLHKAGFTKVRVLYIADNFGTDWVYKGYPTVKGQ